MRSIVMPAAVAALTLLAACNGGAANNSVATNNIAAPANAMAASPASVAPAQAPAPTVGEAVDQSFVVGHWGVRPGCSETVSFEEDGTVRVSDDPRTGRWALNGEVLIITPPEGAGRPARVTKSGDTLLATPEGGGQTMTLTRCEAAAAQPGAAK